MKWRLTNDIEDILNDPGYTHPLDQGFRQGGLSIQQGKKLDVAKVGKRGKILCLLSKSFILPPW